LVSIRIGAPVNIGGISTGIADDGEDDHGDDENNEEDAADNICALSLVGMDGSVSDLGKSLLVLWC